MIEYIELLINQEQLTIFYQVLLAMLFGGMIGFDREMAKKPAGLRTNMFVSGTACLLVSLAPIIIQKFQGTFPDQLVQSDPIRVVEAVIEGISFLAAGTIIRNTSENVVGLTTAASLVLSAAIGICVAMNQYGLAALVTLTTLIVLRILAAVEKKIRSN